MSVLTAGVVLFVGIDVGLSDVVRLNNGGEARGRLVTEIARTVGSRVVIETLLGTRIEFEETAVAFVVRRRVEYEQYESRLAETDDTIEGQWEMAEWCRRQKLNQQRAVHLRRIVELEPGHRQARVGLGHIFREGRWVPRDEYMRSRGLVRYRGRYISPQEREDLRRDKTQRRAFTRAANSWSKKIRLWHGWLSSSKREQRLRGYQELFGVREPAAIAGLVKTLGQDRNSEVRLLLVRALGEIPGSASVEPLLKLALEDADSTVRSMAWATIGESRSRQAIPGLQQALTHAANPVVRRAAVLLGEIGEIQVVPTLIEALQTRHRYRVRVPGSDKPSFGFARDGTPVHPAVAAGFGVPLQVLEGMQRGEFPYGVIIVPSQFAVQQTHVITVEVGHQNSEVRNALKRLTGEDLAFDQRSWRLWWLAFIQGAASGQQPASPAIPGKATE